MYAGQLQRAAEEAREAARLNPNSESYANLLTPYVDMNRFDEAKAVFEEARARKLDDWHLHTWLYVIALVQGDKALMDEQWSWARNNPDSAARRWALMQLGDTAMYYGRFRAARQFYSAVPDYDP